MIVEFAVSSLLSGFVPAGDINRVHRSTSRFTDANSDRSPLQPVRSYDQHPTATVSGGKNLENKNVYIVYKSYGNKPSCSLTAEDSTLFF